MMTRGWRVSWSKPLTTRLLLLALFTGAIGCGNSRTAAGTSILPGSDATSNGSDGSDGSDGDFPDSVVPSTCGSEIAVIAYGALGAEGDVPAVTYDEAAWTGSDAALLGMSVSLGYDTDGDGLGDFLISAPGRSATDCAPSAFLRSGATGSAIWTWTTCEPLDAVLLGPDVDGDDLADVMFLNTRCAALYSTGSGAWLRSWQTAEGSGIIVAFGPDADGDGRGDVLIGHRKLGGVYLFSGSSGDRLRVWRTEAVDDEFGAAVSLGPDADGDGLADVVIGAPSGAPIEDVDGAPAGKLGSAALYSGATGAQVFVWRGEAPLSLFGNRVTLGPDTNGDARADVLIAAPGSVNGGTVYHYSGATGELLRSYVSPEGEVTSFGMVTALGPDADGDGAGDVLVATRNPWNQWGAAYLFSGADGSLIWSRRGDRALGTEWFGVSGSIGGDTDGDGRADWTIGAPYFGPIDAEWGRAYRFSSNEL